jgi:menaquinone-dependent protoporphyrinogen IX oxidase
MKTLIIYGTQYGSTTSYAERLAKKTGIEAVDYKDAKKINDYNKIIYLGALYAGGVTGLKKTVSKMSSNQDLIIATVGLADPTDSDNIKNIRNSIKNQIPPKFYDESKIFHLRGAIDYRRLGIKHKVMMSMLHSKVSKMPKSELNAEAKAMLETYGQKVDFIDFDALEQIINKLQ